MFGLRTALPGARSLGKFTFTSTRRWGLQLNNGTNNNNRGSKRHPAWLIGARNLIRPTKNIYGDNTLHHGSPFDSVS